MENGQQSTGMPAGRSNPFEGFIQFLEEVWAELHRVQWPNKATIIKHTVVVISVLIFMAIYVGAWDFLWTQAFKYLLHVREY